MKKRKLHIHPIIAFFIFAFLLGFIYTLLVYQGYWRTLISGFSSISIFWYPLILIGCFYLTLTFHELGHLVAFKLKGVHIRAIYITIFTWIKQDKGFVFKINLKLWVLFGGLVIPDMEDIEDEETYQKVLHAFQYSLIAAPFVTIALLILTWIIFLVLWFFTFSFVWIGLFGLITIIVSLLSAIYIYSFTLSNPMFYGDFVAHKKMKEDPIFQLIQINQYVMFSTLSKKSFHPFLWTKSKELAKTITTPQNRFQTILLQNYLEGMIEYGMKKDLIIDQKLKNINVNSHTRTEQGLLFLYDLCFYHYLNQDVERAYLLFEQIQIKASKKIPDKLKTYLKVKAMHIMHIEYQDAFLNDPENYYLGMSWIFDGIVDFISSIQEQHKKLPFQLYECAINLEEEKEKSDA